MNIAIYFAAVDATGQQVAATATVQSFVINRPEAYGLAAELKGMRHPSSDVATGYNLLEPLIVTVGKHAKMGVRVTDIVSASAIEIRIAVQEIQ